MTKHNKTFKFNTKTAIISILLLIIIAGSSVFAYYKHMESEVNKWNDRIYPGVSVQGVNLDGKTKEEAITKLKEEFGDAIINKKIKVKAKDKEYTMDYSKLNAKYDIEEVVDEAFNFGKDDTLRNKYKKVNSSSNKELGLKFDYDPKYVKEFVGNIGKEVDKAPKNAKLNFNGGFSVTNEVIGYKTNQEDLEKQILDSINGNVNEETNLQAKIEEDKPSVTGDALRRINGKISTHSTNYSSSSAERSFNIELSTKAINGVVLMPGEVFSYNDVVGERSAARGYKDAPVIIGNKVESGVGGGICQVSSTLYQSIIRSGLSSVERLNHSIPVGYMTKGFDATVAWGSIDYKFKNTFDFPIYIQGDNSGKNVTFNIYGDTSSMKRRYEIYSEVVETLNPTTKTVQDSTLPEGQTVMERNPAPGYRVKTYRKVFENEKLINTELLSTDTYAVVNGVQKVGTKK
ncbi:VanW family protein [Clostridium hydrogeniformans]|uniref:VanW family protein n=1 Tax=Clostridium hydrogeniformans TaxID=349933 RepID=UPI000484EE11|nr:VanW family protein [Clostridium hydrogeniformans]